MHQPRVIATLRQHPCDNVFLADVRLCDVLDRDAFCLSEGCSAIPHEISQRHGELRVVEDADAPGIKEPRHAICVAYTRQRPSDHHPVIAGQNPSDPLTVALNQRLAHVSPYRPEAWAVDYTRPFGSGSAGLGHQACMPSFGLCPSNPCSRSPLRRWKRGR